MSIEAIKEQLRAIPEVAAWPEIGLMLDKPLRRQTFNCWDYPGIAARAVGGTGRAGAAGGDRHLLQPGQHPPGGRHPRRGSARPLPHVGQRQGGQPGAGAAGGWRPGCWPKAPRRRPRKSCLQKSLAVMAIATAWGQQLDSEDRPGEAAYWETIRLKTPPLFGCALELGALLAGAAPATAQAVAALGGPIGEMVQVNDDLHDALRGARLPRLAARRRQSGHPLRPHGPARRPRPLRRRCARRSAVETSLREAQDLLIASGAVSYCAYSTSARPTRRARRLIDEAALPAPAALCELIDSHIEPLLALLRSLGVKAPEALLRG